MSSTHNTKRIRKIAMVGREERGGGTAPPPHKGYKGLPFPQQEGSVR